MKRLRIAALTLLPLIGVACATTTDNEIRNGSLSGTHRLVGHHHLAGIVDIQNRTIGFTDTDFAVYQVDLVGLKRDSVTCEYRATWYDDRGFMVQDVTRAWQPVFVTGGSRTPLSIRATNLDAIRCELELRIIQPIED